MILGMFTANSRPVTILLDLSSNTFSPIFEDHSKTQPIYIHNAVYHADEYPRGKKKSGYVYQELRFKIRGVDCSTNFIVLDS